MSNYRRVYVMGGWYFFTLVTYQRYPLFRNPENISHLRNAFAHVIKKHPFSIKAIVILPDHLHCIWSLPDDDKDYSTRWRLIKHYFSRQKISCPLDKIWQPRFWEHFIRDETDLKNHIDYIHYNPVKHGLASSPAEWRHSTFHKYVRHGWYDKDWGQQVPDKIKSMDFE